MRDPRIELYRCLHTLGIVILHVIGFYGKEWHWLSSAFVWCVPGFVFITGYFGLKFSLKKIVRLYGICLWCFPVSILMGQVLSTGRIDLSIWLIDSWKAFIGNWFVHAYIGLMMLTPIIDYALKDLRDLSKEGGILGPFLFLIFVWSFLSNYNCVNTVLPKAPSCSVLTLLGIYVVARLFRKHDVESKISTLQALVMFVACVALAMLRIGKFNSVISLGITIGSFVLARRINMPGWLSAVVLGAGPSMFSVFLIHANKWVLSSMHGFVDKVSNICGAYTSVAFLIVAIAIFSVSFVLDVPRRLCVLWFQKKLV